MAGAMGNLIMMLAATGLLRKEQALRILTTIIFLATD